jgi:hypothetical protein
LREYIRQRGPTRLAHRLDSRQRIHLPSRPSSARSSRTPHLPFGRGCPARIRARLAGNSDRLTCL